MMESTILETGDSSSNVRDPPLFTFQITDPKKHGEGSTAFISYQIITTSALFPSSCSVRRRFNEFDTLHKAMSDENPQCIMPPAPGKHRMEYINGDRFAPDFIEKRRNALVAYLERLSRHSILNKSKLFREFLTSSDLSPFIPRSPTSSFEHISEAILNAFSKVKTSDPKFTKLKQDINQFEDSLSAIEKLHLKYFKQQSELEQDLSELVMFINGLAEMEPQLKQPLSDVANTFRNVSISLKESVQIINLVEYTRNRIYPKHSRFHCILHSSQGSLED